MKTVYCVVTIAVWLSNLFFQSHCSNPIDFSTNSMLFVILMHCVVIAYYVCFDSTACSYWYNFSFDAVSEVHFRSCYFFVLCFFVVCFVVNVVRKCARFLSKANSVAVVKKLFVHSAVRPIPDFVILRTTNRSKINLWNSTVTVALR